MRSSRDNAWPRATLASTRRHNDKLWLYCNGCHRSYTVLHDEFVAFHGLDHELTFPEINARMRCIICGEKKGQCRSEPYGIERRKAYPVAGSADEGPQPARRILQLPYEPPRSNWPEISDDEQIEF